MSPVALSRPPLLPCWSPDWRDCAPASCPGLREPLRLAVLPVVPAAVWAPLAELRVPPGVALSLPLWLPVAPAGVLALLWLPLAPEELLLDGKDGMGLELALGLELELELELELLEVELDGDGIDGMLLDEELEDDGMEGMLLEELWLEDWHAPNARPMAPASNKRVN